MKLMNLKDTKYANISLEQKARFQDFMNKLEPVYDKLNASHLLNVESIDKVFKVSEEVTNINLNWVENYFDNKILKVFHNKDRWHLLHLVIKASATHQLVYKQKLAEEMKVSVKTVYELIEEYIASGHFIKLAPTKINGRKIDNRVTNIRPSVDVTVAYLDVNFDHIKHCVRFLREHTKITFDFNR